MSNENLIMDLYNKRQSCDNKNSDRIIREIKEYNNDDGCVEATISLYSNEEKCINSIIAELKEQDIYAEIDSKGRLYCYWGDLTYSLNKKHAKKAKRSLNSFKIGIIIGIIALIAFTVYMIIHHTALLMWLLIAGLIVSIICLFAID